jgi:hypothetical protein
VQGLGGELGDVVEVDGSRRSHYGLQQWRGGVAGGRLAAWQGWQVVKTRNSWDRPKERERRGGVGRAIDKHGARCWRRIQGKGIRQGSDYAGSGMDGGPAAAMGGTVT